MRKWQSGQLVAEQRIFDFSGTSQRYTRIPSLDVQFPCVVYIVTVGISVSRIEGGGIIRVRVFNEDDEASWSICPDDAQDFVIHIRASGDRVCVDLIGHTKTVRLVGVMSVVFQSPEPSAVDQLAEIADDE